MMHVLLAAVLPPFLMLSYGERFTRVQSQPPVIPRSVLTWLQQAQWAAAAVSSPTKL